MNSDINKKLHDILTDSGEESLSLVKIKNKLGKDIKAALGITGKTTVGDMAGLISPHLDDGLGISQSGKTFVLYTKRDIDPAAEINYIFKEYAKDGKLTLAELKKRSDAQFLEHLGLTAKSTAADIKNAIEPYLGDSLCAEKKGSSFIVVRRMVIDADYILKYLLNNDGSTIKKLTKDIKLPQDELMREVNALLEDGRLSVRFKKHGKAYEPCLYISVNSNASLSRQPDVPAKADITVKAFREAFLKHDSGNFFVRICDIRRELGRSREVFDDMLRKLRDECVIQLHVGDVSMLTNDEVNDCFIDENGIRMGTVTWNE